MLYKKILTNLLIIHTFIYETVFVLKWWAPRTGKVGSDIDLMSARRDLSIAHLFMCTAAEGRRENLGLLLGRCFVRKSYCHPQKGSQFVIK